MTPTLLKTTRLRLGLSQRILGEQLGLQRNTITRWERELSPISTPILLKLALERLIQIHSVNRVIRAGSASTWVEGSDD